jgi:hypothetical protein
VWGLAGLALAVDGATVYIGALGGAVVEGVVGTVVFTLYSN